MRQADHVNGRLLRHKWNDDDRVLLTLMFRLYKNSHDQLLQIWNYLHRDTLLAEGFPPTGFPLQAMRSQISEMKRGGVGSSAWRSVMDISLSEARRSFSAHKISIEEAAQLLQIRLRPKLATSEGQGSILKKPKIKGTVKNIVATADADEWDSSSSSSGEDEEESPCERSKTNKMIHRTVNTSVIRSFAYNRNAEMSPRVQQVTGRARLRDEVEIQEIGRPLGPPMLRIRDPTHPNSPRRVTALLFRAFLAGHGFRARKFLTNSNKVPPPPPMASEAFLEKVEPHLRQYLGQNATYPSPFLSLAENPVNALKRISKSQLPLSFAIFYSPEVTADARARYGDLCLPYPYLTTSICSIHDIDDLPGGYSGTGEVRRTL
jgi:hypothetical protein